MESYITPGTFGSAPTADNFRTLFDILNEQIIYRRREVDFVFLGDSLFQHWDLDLWFSPDKYKVNRGIGGDMSRYMLLRSEADVFQLHPHRAIVMAGTNDLLTTAPDLWWRKPGADEDKVISELLGNLEALLERASEHPETAVSLCSVLPADLRQPFDKYRFAELVLRANRGIRELCERKGTQYIDFHSALTADDGLLMRDGITHDGVHPCGEGYAAMAHVLTKALPELGAS